MIKIFQTPDFFDEVLRWMYSNPTHRKLEIFPNDRSKSFGVFFAGPRRESTGTPTTGNRAPTRPLFLFRIRRFPGHWAVEWLEIVHQSIILDTANLSIYKIINREMWIVDAHGHGDKKKDKSSATANLENVGFRFLFNKKTSKQENPAILNKCAAKRLFKSARSR